ncbi:uncharacterized protein LOC143066783 [Mytilus galloprovincialis]|uniref:uncharacterized protein LOC143066783 n=1 Tax=Mytilus galloprovincialis TaxID=29158 RepID=UPI003F7B4B62
MCQYLFVPIKYYVTSVFKRLPDALTLSSRRHVLSVNIIYTDYYGIELDELTISTTDYYLIEESFKCSSYCDRNIIVVDIFLVSGSYNAKGVLLALDSTYLSRQKTKHEWIIPKQSWSVQNEILFYIFTYPSEIKSITIEYIKLEYQAIETKHREVLFIDPAMKVEVFTDVFERTDIKQKTMTVRNVDTSQEILNVSEIVISHISPWTNIYSPIVKLSRQGEMHILPIPPHRLTEIPYGSSIIIGQNDPSKNFPMASISKIDIAPQAKKLFVTFKDNGSSTIIIKFIWQQTEVIFKDIITTRNPNEYPFATLVTTWKYDGNADVDHVSTNGDTVHHIVQGWDELYGTSFTFFRQCLSMLNTQSPDLRVQLINEQECVLST